MFQMDQADLDFGIYRIMNQKRDEIERFLDKELLPQVKREFAKYKDAKAEERQKELEKLIKTLEDADVDPDTNPKVLKVKEEMAAYGDEESLANEVFSHLTTFFRRYYDGGDFLSLRRYKKDTYAIPYEGEEVKLHWANADQYYIKSSEYLRDYVFKLPGQKRVHFKLIDATEEKDNIKQVQGKERRFRLYDSEPIKIEGDNLYIQFTYLPDNTKQADLNKKTLEYLIDVYNKPKGLDNFDKLFEIMPTAKNPNRTLLEKRLNDYTARFNFDFFIHKDLGGFLRRELDFYIKNEMLFIDDLDEQDEKKVFQSIGKVKALKRIAQKIIAFLVQLEDYQKKLWLKKKFVVECGYCVTLDRVPEELYDEIAQNDAQREEWVRLFAIDEIKKDLTNSGYTKPLTVKFLKTNPYMVLDTKHFDEIFREKLLASFDNLDEACDGVIINSENFQALNLLVEKYREQVKCVYIDPPFNTGPTEIIYKNAYKDSSWLSLINDRVLMSLQILDYSSCYAIAIDDYEMVNLCEIIDSIFINYDRNMIVVNHHPQGGMSKNTSRTHEYMLVMVPSGEDILKGKAKTGEIEYRSFALSGPGDNKSRSGRPNSFYALLIDKNQNKIVGIEPPPNLDSDYPKDKTKEGYYRLYPLSPTGEEKVWCRAYESALEGIRNNEIILSENGSVKLAVNTIDKRFNLMSNWTDSRYNAGPHGTALLANIVGSKDYFSYPKSLHTVTDAIDAMTHLHRETLILDYFAGSGTTGHAVINLNREDNGNRKYILVEMGQYFDTVLKPRIQKVVYSKDWKDAKPVSREGISHMFKYMKLESYEDTLDNLIIKHDKKRQKALTSSKTAKEEYMLGYWLDIETRESDSLLNIDKFEDPFNYTLAIRHDNELKTTKVDLVETFNYLIGLYVEQTEVIRGFKVIRGRLRTGEKTLVIWRNTKEKPNKELDAFFLKQGYNTQDFEFDRIFVNGDNNLENLKVAEDKWKVSLIEEEFKKRMFDVKDM